MPHHYTPQAKILHWLMALLLVALLLLGFYMHDLPLSPEKLQRYSWHKWGGITALPLVALRLLWRAGHRPPALPEHMPRRVRAAARAGHVVLYGLMITIPLSGWLMSSAQGFQTVYFGVLPIPDLLGKDKELGILLGFIHRGLNLLLIAALIAHVGAALKHHFIDKDDILMRMLPKFR